MKFAGHRNPKTLVGHYLDDMSNVDGAAAYLGLEPRRDITEDFRSASMGRNPGLLHSLAAKGPRLRSWSGAKTMSNSVCRLRISPFRSRQLPRRKQEKNSRVSRAELIIYDENSATKNWRSTRRANGESTTLDLRHMMKVTGGAATSTV